MTKPSSKPSCAGVARATCATTLGPCKIASGVGIQDGVLFYVKGAGRKVGAAGRWGLNAVAHPRHEDADLLVAKQPLLEAENRQLRQLLDAQEQYIAELRRLLGGGRWLPIGTLFIHNMCVTKELRRPSPRPF